eukprot:SAG22_NODE_12266_length_449_cov_1.185714_1_plen_53_part_10
MHPLLKGDPGLLYLGPHTQVKIWAKKAGVADATNGTLSSYAWALLGVHYLQHA